MISSGLLKLKVFCSLLFWRVALWLFPLTWIFWALRARRPQPQLHQRPQLDLDQGLVQTIHDLSPFVPCSTCLTRAIVSYFLCCRRTAGIELCLGVARDPDGAFHSHAWVRDQERILIGNEDLLRYQIIYRLSA